MKEADIRPTDLHEEYLRLSKQDAEVYFSDSSRWKDIPCVGCDSGAVTVCFVKDGFTYVRCFECGTLFQSPRPSLDSFEQFYVESPSSNYWAETFFPKVAEARRELIFKPRVEEITAYCEKKGLAHETVIDVGAGYGIFLDEWRKLHPVDFVCAVEPSKKLAKVCRDNGIETLEAMAEQAQAWGKRADITTCFEVIEHVHNPLSFLKSLQVLMKPGSHILITGLGVDGFDIQVLWAASKSISPPHHINFISVVGFKRLFERAGFDEVEILTPGKLDVDIVAKCIDEDPELGSQNRFAQLIVNSSESVRQEFQRFLQENLMSSHVWIYARLPY